MSSTYTLNNGIELIGTGEQSGTWGATTNTNFELLDTALDGQVTITASSAGSSGSPNSLPVSDGAASNGRNRLVNITSGTDLGATVYYQLTPSDAEKIIYIRNSLNTQSLIVFQGTYNASNDYEIPNGKTAIIFFNGAGSGAVAANVMSNAHFDALNIVGNAVVGGILSLADGSNSAPSLTNTGDTNTGLYFPAADEVGITTGGTQRVKVDSTGVDITGTASADQLNSKNGKLFLDDNGSHNGVINAPASLFVNFDSDNTSASESIVFGYDRDGTSGGTSVVTINSTGLGIGTSSLNAQFTSYKSLNGDPQLGHFYNDNSGAAAEAVIYITNSSTLADGLFLQTYGANATTVGGFVQDASIIGSGTGASGGLSIMTRANADMRFYTNGHTNERMRIDSSGDLTVKGGRIFINESDNGNTAIALTRDADEGYVNVYSAGAITSSIRGNGDSYFNGGNVGIGTTLPAYNLHVSGSEGILRLSSTSSGTNFDIGSGSAGQTFLFQRANSYMHFGTNNTERMRIDSSGNVGIGVVPEAWSSLYGTKALQVGAQASLSDINGDLHLSSNAYYDTTNARWEYINADFATKYTQVDGVHQWLTAASGSADAAITWSESMRIDSSGRVLIGTPTSFADANSDDLQISGSGDTGMIIKSGTSSYGSIYFGDGTSGDARNEGILRYNHSDNKMQLWTSAQERVRLGTHFTLLNPTSTDSRYFGITNSSGSTGWTFGNGVTTAAHKFEIYDNTNGATRLLIHPTGEVRHAANPAFLMHTTSTTTTTSSGAWATITMNNEAYDVGGNFSSNTFTAPVTGKYQMNVQLLVSAIDTAANYYVIDCSTSNRNYHYLFYPTNILSADTSFQFIWSFVADMDQGDTAFLRINQNGGTLNQTTVVADPNYTRWTGYMMG